MPVVDAKDSHGHTALVHAVIQGKSLDCVKALIDAGADVDTPMRARGILSFVPVLLRSTR